MGYWEALQGDEGAVEVTQVGGAGEAGRWEEGVQEAALCRPGDWLGYVGGRSGFRPGSPGKWWCPP